MLRNSLRGGLNDAWDHRSSARPQRHTDFLQAQPDNWGKRARFTRRVAVARLVKTFAFDPAAVPRYRWDERSVEQSGLGHGS